MRNINDRLFIKHFVKSQNLEVRNTTKDEDETEERGLPKGDRPIKK